MHTTGIFRVHKFSISLDKIGDPIYLIPFSDIHRSSPNCDVDLFKDSLARWKRLKNAYFLGVGDYDDFASTSERMIFSNRGLHESTRDTLEDVYKSNVDRLVREMSFMKGRLIGLLEGNHYAEFQNGTTTTQLMCDKLETKYLGVSAFIRLVISYHRKRYSLSICAHHGKGASRLIGGSINRVQQMGEGVEADIYLMGHDHKKSCGTASKLYLSDFKGKVTLKHRKQLYVRTGGYLKGYEDGRASYIADAALNPTDLGTPIITLTPKVVRSEAGRRFTVDISSTI